MSWYDSNNNNGESWYSSAQQNRGYYVPNPASQATNMPGGKRTRTYAIVFCLILIAASLIMPLFYEAPDADAPKNDGSALPYSWKKYFDIVCGTTEEPKSECTIEAYKGKSRFELSFKDVSAMPKLSYNEIYESCSPAIVGIKGYKDKNNVSYSWGSGMAVSSDGFILTNAHIIEDCSSAEVIISGEEPRKAQLVGIDSIRDVAILKIEVEGLKYVSFASSDTLSVGDSVAAIGNPIGPNYSLSMTSGIVSAVGRELSFNGSISPFIQTDASMNSGSSGGPLINDRGLVVGITNMKLVSSISTVEGMGFAIPSDTLESIIELFTAETLPVGDPIIGVTLCPVEKDIAEYYEIPQGLYVASVIERSDAGKKGILKNDIVTKINGTEVKTNGDVLEIKKGLKVGDSLKITIWRDGETLEFDVKLSDYNEIHYKK